MPTVLGWSCLLPRRARGSPETSLAAEASGKGARSAKRKAPKCVGIKVEEDDRDRRDGLPQGYLLRTSTALRSDCHLEDPNASTAVGLEAGIRRCETCFPMSPASGWSLSCPHGFAPTSQKEEGRRASGPGFEQEEEEERSEEEEEEKEEARTMPIWGPLQACLMSAGTFLKELTAARASRRWHRRNASDAPSEKGAPDQSPRISPA